MIPYVHTIKEPFDRDGLKAYRKWKNWTQAQLAEVLGYSTGYIARLETWHDGYIPEHIMAGIFRIEQENRKPRKRAKKPMGRPRKHAPKSWNMDQATLSNDWGLPTQEEVDLRREVDEAMAKLLGRPEE